MYKKIQSLVLAGIISTNTLSSATTVFANDMSTQENTNIETLTEKDENTEEVLSTPPVESIVNEGVTGGRNTPYILKVNTEKGLKQVFDVLNNEDTYTNYYRLKDAVVNGDATTYKLHVFTKSNMVIYVDIKVDNSNTDLVEKLKLIPELISVVEMEKGDGTVKTPHKVKANTVDGVTELLEWLNVYCSYTRYRSPEIISENGFKIYELYAPIEDIQTTYTSNNQYICIRIVVDEANAEVLDYLNDIEVVPVNDTTNTPDATPDNNTGTDTNEPNYGEEYAPEESKWKKFSTANDLTVGNWNYEIVNDANGKVVLLKAYTGTDKMIEIPRTIDGMRVELENFDTASFPNVTHIRIAKGNNNNNNNKVKLRPTELYRAFYKNLDIQYLDLRGLDVSEVTRLQDTFNNCDNLQYLNLSGWNTQKVDTFEAMLYNCKKLKFLNLSGWRIEKRSIDPVETFSFSIGANNLKDFIFRDTDVFTFNELKNEMILGEVTLMDVTNMEVTQDRTSLNALFKMLKKIVEITGLETWKNTEKIESMSNMFQGCISLTNIDGMKKWILSNVTSTAGMFKGCTSLETLDLTIFDMEKVKSAYGMFQDCSNLKEIKGTEGWILNRAQDISDMFRGCEKLRFIDFSKLSLSSNPNMSNMFKTDNRTSLLIISSDSKIKEYNFRANNRICCQLTFDSKEGKFGDGQTKKYADVFVLDATKGANLVEAAEYTVNEKKGEVEIPKSDVYAFDGWKLKETNYSDNDMVKALQMLNDTYEAVWIDDMISVTVPLNTLSFGLNTDAPEGESPFTAQDLNIINNSATRSVSVSVLKLIDTTGKLPYKVDKLQLLDPNDVTEDYWNNIVGKDSYTKMAIGIYSKNGINNQALFTENNPLWLVPNKTSKTMLGTIPPASKANLGFSAKHAQNNNFMDGKAHAEFKLTIMFE